MSVAPLDPGHLLALVRADDLDAALAAGLMAFDPNSVAHSCDAQATAELVAAQHRLRTAWAARDRYRARTARLARRAAERDARRAPPPAPDRKPALPPMAAAILARAKARAAGTPSS